MKRPRMSTPREIDPGVNCRSRDWTCMTLMHSILTPPSVANPKGAIS